MLKGLFTAYTSMVNEQHRLDVVSNNLANVNTNGYKKEGATSQAFKDVLGYKIKDAAEAPNLPRRLGVMNMGVKIGENYVDYQEGPMKATGNQWDLAIGGKGFFAVEFTNKAGETSVKYTRDGNFNVDSEGYLVTQDGDKVLNNRGRLYKSDGNFEVDEAGYLVNGRGDRVLSRNGQEIKLDPSYRVNVLIDGRVIQNNRVVARVDTSDIEDHNFGTPIRLNLNAQETTVHTNGDIYQDGALVGTIQMVDFEDYNYLERYGENYFEMGVGANQIEPENARLYTGYLEQSNVSVVDEMVNMIAIQRHYESNQKVITTYDSSLDIAVNQLGKVTG